MPARRVRVAEAGMAIEPNAIYLAPGDAHLIVVEGRRRREIALDRRAVDNGCCPSADPMLDSVAEVYGKGGIAVILRGMRSEERRVGNGCVRTCLSRWSPYH